MLSYRHGFHAGNHADVLKHMVLVGVLDYLMRKDKPLAFIDTHAGGGRYRLDSAEALCNREFETGIARVWEPGDWPELVEAYRRRVRALNGDGRLRVYPGSPRLAQQMLREQDRLQLFELHSAECVALRQLMAGDRRVEVLAEDGLAGLARRLPPVSRRGLVLIDPSYEVKADYHRVPAALREALKRFAVGVYAVWYPLLQRPEALQLPRRLRGLAPAWLDVRLQVAAPAAQGMHGSGMLVINPPWTLAQQLREALPVLVSTLGGDGAEWLLESEGLD